MDFLSKRKRARKSFILSFSLSLSLLLCNARVPFKRFWVSRTFSDQLTFSVQYIDVYLLISYNIEKIKFKLNKNYFQRCLDIVDRVVQDLFVSIFCIHFKRINEKNSSWQVTINLKCNIIYPNWINRWFIFLLFQVYHR